MGQDKSKMTAHEKKRDSIVRRSERVTIHRRPMTLYKKAMTLRKKKGQ